MSALLDILKKKKPEPVKESVKKNERPEQKKKSFKKIIKVSDSAYKVLLGPHITEKATDLSVKDQYVFKVFQRTNKIQIKKAVEDIYNVNVLKVRIINVPKKARTMGKIKGWRKGYKKAIIKIKKGQKIDVFPR
ncbi:MAG: 50S ribosomal protein L23 [Candidatus Pacebacteria bacterium]|nr:50S ribosomal protein L23 [Candidatus Paceibacterota bacterium]